MIHFFSTMKVIKASVIEASLYLTEFTQTW